MNPQSVTVECHCDDLSSLFNLIDGEQFQKLGYEVTWLDDWDQAVEFPLDGRKVKINLRDKWEGNFDVCVVEWLIDEAEFIDEMKDDARRCKQQCPNASIIVVGDAQWKNDPETMGKAELKGRKFINRKMGDKLAREVGANKYVEYSWQNGRGIKILFDEIAYAYFAKLKDEEERRETEIREKEQIIQRTKIEKKLQKISPRSFFCFVFACLMVIISIIVNVIMI